MVARPMHWGVVQSPSWKTLSRWLWNWLMDRRSFGKRRAAALFLPATTSSPSCLCDFSSTMDSIWHGHQVGSTFIILDVGPFDAGKDRGALWCIGRKPWRWWRTWNSLKWRALWMTRRSHGGQRGIQKCQRRCWSSWWARMTNGKIWIMAACPSIGIVDDSWKLAAACGAASLCGGWTSIEKMAVSSTSWLPGA